MVAATRLGLVDDDRVVSPAERFCFFYNRLESAGGFPRARGAAPPGGVSAWPRGAERDLFIAVRPGILMLDQPFEAGIENIHRSPHTITHRRTP